MWAVTWKLKKKCFEYHYLKQPSQVFRYIVYMFQFKDSVDPSMILPFLRAFLGNLMRLCNCKEIKSL